MQFNFDKKKRGVISSSARYCSISVHRNKLTHSRLAKNRFLFFKHFLSKILFFVILASFGYILFFSSFFKTTKIIISGNTIINTDEVRLIVENIAQKKVFNFFNNTLILMENEEIKKKIREKFNNIENINIVKSFPKTIIISISEKPSDLLWCTKIKVEKMPLPTQFIGNNSQLITKENSIQETSQCYFSDESNILYNKIQSDEVPGSIKIFQDDSLFIGKTVSDNAVKKFIRELSKNFYYKTGLQFSYLYLPAISLRELHLFTKNGWKIIFDLNSSINDQLDILNNVWKDIIPEENKNNNNIEYIDLRLPGRVIWKPKQ